MNKFRELKNKGKQRTKDLPMPEPKALDEVEVSTLLESLNEPVVIPVVEEVTSYVSGKTPNAKPIVINSNEPKEKYLTAYAVVFNEERNKFVKIEIKFNPISGHSSIDSIVDWSDDPMTGLHKLNKILSLKLLKREDKY